jgi:AcrR family transcriptional regulator
MPRKTRWDKVRRTAAELFAANGFAAASLSRLARQARLSKPGIYYHVRDKEELLFRICQGTMAVLLQSVQAALRDAGDPVSKLQHVIRAHADHYWDHSWDLVILFGQRRYLSPARQRRIIALERQYLDLVRAIIRDGVKQRVFRPLDPSLAAFALFAILNTLDAWYDRRGSLRAGELVKQIEELLLSGLLRGEGSAPRRQPGRRRAAPRAVPARAARRAG